MPSSGWNERRGFLEGAQSLVLANSASTRVCFQAGQQAHELPYVLFTTALCFAGGGGAKGTRGVWAREASCHRQLRGKSDVILGSYLLIGLGVGGNGSRGVPGPGLEGGRGGSSPCAPSFPPPLTDRSLGQRSFFFRESKT